ncbi:hypothetical protein ISCGN_008718 [Ixodes scapularis]
MPTDAAWVGCSFRATPSGPPGTAGADPPDTPLRNRGPLPRPSDRVLTDDGDQVETFGSRRMIGRAACSCVLLGNGTRGMLGPGCDHVGGPRPGRLQRRPVVTKVLCYTPVGGASACDQLGKQMQLASKNCIINMHELLQSLRLEDK